MAKRTTEVTQTRVTERVTEQVTVTQEQSLVDAALEQPSEPKTKVSGQLKCQALCCGVWHTSEVISVTAEIDSRGRLSFQNPVQLPEGTDRVKLMLNTNPKLAKYNNRPDYD